MNNKTEQYEMRNHDMGRTEEIGDMEVEREWDKGAWGQFWQQELRGPFHYDSSSFFMPSGIDRNL